MSTGLVYLPATTVCHLLDCAQTAGEQWTTLLQWVAQQRDNGLVVNRLLGLHWPERRKIAGLPRPDFEACAEISLTDRGVAVSPLTTIKRVDGGPFARCRMQPNDAGLADRVIAQADALVAKAHFERDPHRPVIEIHLEWESPPLAFQKTELLVPIQA